MTALIVLIVVVATILATLYANAAWTMSHDTKPRDPYQK
jgi:hypothetical protein